MRVNGFGMFFLLMYPGAFVDLSSEHLQVVSPLRQLRIYCAGVWHNFVIVVVALIILLSQPALLMPFYATGQAVAITSVAEVKLLTSLRAELINHDFVIVCVGGDDIFMIVTICYHYCKAIVIASIHHLF